ncbi:MAG: ATP-binding protein [Proteobacteria bacterium]|nr:ATP-binding protein [Pseudomonadota bacterium]
MSGRHATVPGEVARLPELTRFLQDFWTAERLPAAQASAFEVALEEIFVNSVTHGSRGGTRVRVEVSLAVADGGVTMTVEDDGPQFDPLTLPPPDVDCPLEQRPVGGLGIHLVRRMMDTVSYQRVGAHNRLRMTRRIEP